MQQLQEEINRGLEKMRKIFAKFITEIIKKDKKVILIVGDIGYGLFDEIREKYPKQFINIGICEQSMISIASGMALEGMKPYVYTITPFLIERPFEQIKLDIDHMKTNVKLVGFADYPEAGITHQELDGKTLMSMFKNIKSFFPTDSESTLKMLKEGYKTKQPCFYSLKGVK